jgi:hypothetical protein
MLSHFISQNHYHTTLPIYSRAAETLYMVLVEMDFLENCINNVLESMGNSIEISYKFCMAFLDFLLGGSISHTFSVYFSESEVYNDHVYGSPSINGTSW